MYKNSQNKAECQVPPIADASPDRQSAHQLNGYDFIRLLGRGAQGETWLAKNKDGELFAIKVYDLRLMQGWKDETFLRREVAVLQQLDIKGVPKYYDFIEDLPKYYLVMEYISAPTLQSRIDAGQRPKNDDVKILLLSLARIIAKFHSCSLPIIHRDIKPANIMVDDNYNAWIVDFGVVASQEQQTFASTVAGSVGYMAPELMMGRATTAVDIYSLGATMLHFISGKAPHTMDGDGINLNYAPHLPQNLSPKFRGHLDAMLAVFPEDRVASGRELLKRIRPRLPRIRALDEGGILWNKTAFVVYRIVLIILALLLVIDPSIAAMLFSFLFILVIVIGVLVCIHDNA